MKTGCLFGFFVCPVFRLSGFCQVFRFLTLQPPARQRQTGRCTQSPGTRSQSIVCGSPGVCGGELSNDR